MRIAKVTEKTIRIEGEPGDRINLDGEGFCADSITFKFAGNEKLRSDILNNIIEIKNCDDDDMDLEILLEVRHHLLKAIFELPIYRQHKVWVGFNSRNREIRSSRINRRGLMMAG